MFESYGPVFDQPPCASGSPGWNAEDSKFVPTTSASATAGAAAMAAITAPDTATPRNLPTGLAMARASAISRRWFMRPPSLESQRTVCALAVPAGAPPESRPYAGVTGTRVQRDVKRPYYAINRAVQPFIDSLRCGASGANAA